MKYLTSKEIRDLWTSFFESKEHLFIPSKSVVPINDESLLFINSGIATLKNFFTGKETPPSKRLVSHQKSIRTNDIDKIGKTTRHHVFLKC